MNILRSPLTELTLMAGLVVAAPILVHAQSIVSRPAPVPPSSSVAQMQPRDATARCRDGSFTTTRLVSSGCESHGGVLVSFPVRDAAPATPARAVVVAGARSSAVAAPALPPNAALALPPAAAPQAPVIVASGSPMRVVAASLPPAPVARSAPSARQDAPTITRPAGATAHCKDGSFATEDPTPATCAANGGIAAVLPRATSPAEQPSTPQQSKKPVRKTSASRAPRSE